ncbi:MAG: hypothetical protein MUW56_18880 [Chryseobacterium sp.]|nr:hypothetical protein [Chryseobacterium sp.]MCJ7935627.1 hypothetical protein [Chryseobacterium sp.]
MRKTIIASLFMILGTGLVFAGNSKPSKKDENLKKKKVKVHAPLAVVQQ